MGNKNKACTTDSSQLTVMQMCNKSSTPVKKKTQQEPTKKLTLTQMYQGFTKRYNEENHILEGWKKVWIYGQFVYYDHEEMDLQADSYEQLIQKLMLLQQMRWANIDKVLKLSYAYTY